MKRFFILFLGFICAFVVIVNFIGESDDKEDLKSFLTEIEYLSGYDIDSALKKNILNNKKVLIVFAEPGCSSCSEQMKIFSEVNDQEFLKFIISTDSTILKKALPKNFDVLIYNRFVFDKLGIKFTPTTFIFQSGVQEKKIEGVIDIKSFDELL